MKLRRFLPNLLILGVSVLFGLAAGEILVRLFPRVLSEEAQLRLHWAGLSEGETHGDPYLGFLDRPQSQREVKGIDVAFRYVTDEHGFRNPSPWPTQADVVVLGDSLSFGWGVEDAQTWSSLLAARLPRRRLINLAAPGAGPRQYTRYYERFGASLKPKLVIYGLFPGNDIIDGRMFEDWLQAGSPGNYIFWRFLRGHVPSQASRVLQQSYLVALVRQMGRLRASGPPGRTISCDGDKQLQLAPNFFTKSAERARPGHPDFALVMDAVADARRLATEGGAAFFVLLFPTKEEVYLPIRATRAPEVVAPFVAEFQKQGVPFLDLTAALQEQARAGRCLFFEIDGHPNVEGNRIIADVVQRRLSELASTHRLPNWN